MTFRPTAEFRSRTNSGDAVYLPKDGPAIAVQLYAEIVGAAQRAHGSNPDNAADHQRATIRTRVAAAPAGLRDKVEPYLETALAWPLPNLDKATAGLDAQYELAKAIRAQYEQLEPPPVLDRGDTSKNCRHGVPFSGECPACDEDFA